MEFDQYQAEIKKNDICNGKTAESVPVGMVEKLLGLTGEAGEVADKFKKIYRDRGGKITEEDKEEIVKELGDVLWYVATIARYLDVPFSEVVKKNIEKGESRRKRGKISGSGDNR
ncbi:nucleoside triphosphate pyrophosphohydrolase family protein [Candidatus Saccharibacteria bacterium]|nr:nucleoside triphosphate pyrophosphohydrolase family protein [Candidatus Saccharibacteria bacterium]